jgi:hypothetical protein
MRASNVQINVSIPGSVRSPHSGILFHAPHVAMGLAGVDAPASFISLF